VGQRHRRCRGQAGEQWKETEKITSENIPFIDEKSVRHAAAYLDAHAKDENPFFMYLNTAKLHQPNRVELDQGIQVLALAHRLPLEVGVRQQPGLVSIWMRRTSTTCLRPALATSS
jgi:hypothetical protein